MISEHVTRSWLLAQLEREHRAIVPSVWEACDGMVDVRLQATEHDGWLHVGDASFDTDHTGYWGASAMTQEMGREELSDLAEDLIKQAQEAAAERGDRLDCPYNRPCFVGQPCSACTDS